MNQPTDPADEKQPPGPTDPSTFQGDSIQNNDSPEAAVSIETQLKQLMESTQSLHEKLDNEKRRRKSWQVFWLIMASHFGLIFLSMFIPSSRSLLLIQGFAFGLISSIIVWLTLVRWPVTDRWIRFLAAWATFLILLSTVDQRIYSAEIWEATITTILPFSLGCWFLTHIISRFILIGIIPPDDPVDHARKRPTLSWILTMTAVIAMIFAVSNFLFEPDTTSTVLIQVYLGGFSAAFILIGLGFSAHAKGVLKNTGLILGFIMLFFLAGNHPLYAYLVESELNVTTDTIFSKRFLRRSRRSLRGSC
ncbi:MAG: hypothetical protein AAFN77_03630 [Planctomycetota bacterium]